MPRHLTGEEATDVTRPWRSTPSAGDSISPADRDAEKSIPGRWYIVSVTLADDAIDRDEMREVLHLHLARHQIVLTDDRHGPTVVALRIEAADLWLALLMAMNAVTATGYPPTAVNAYPAPKSPPSQLAPRPDSTADTDQRPSSPHATSPADPVGDHC